MGFSGHIVLGKAHRHPARSLGGLELGMGWGAVGLSTVLRRVVYGLGKNKGLCGEGRAGLMGNWRENLASILLVRREAPLISGTGKPRGVGLVKGRVTGN